MLELKDTYGLLEAIEQIKAPSSYFADTFFPVLPTISPTTHILIEYRKRGRERLAPFVVSGGRGVNLQRQGSTMRMYTPPMIAPRRVLSQADIEQRMFGEMPIISTMTGSERQAQLIADDLVDMLGSISNRKNQMCAELLSTGRIEINGFAEDGRLARIDEVSYEWDGNVSAEIGTDWSNASAKIFDDLQKMSERIQENAGMVPTLLVVGKNVPKYLRQNKEILSWLMVPNRQNLSVASFEPRYVSPQVQYIGQISALGVEVVSYAETYTADDGELAYYLDPDAIVLGVPGRGRILHGALNLINDAETGFETYQAQYVPSYHASKESNAMTLTVYTRFLPVPYSIDDWLYAKVVK